jgi:hypothetical protein
MPRCWREKDTHTFDDTAVVCVPVCLVRASLSPSPPFIVPLVPELMSPLFFQLHSQSMYVLSNKE